MPTNCETSAAGLDSEEIEFARLLNEHRAAHGLAPVSLAPSLNRAAAWMAEDLGSRSQLTHTDSLGRDPFQRALDCGYPTRGSGEVLAGGTIRDTAAEALELLLTSPPHVEVMLSPEFTQAGVARAYVPGSRLTWYWAVDYGTADEQPLEAPGGVPLAVGANLVTWPGPSLDVSLLFAKAAAVQSVYVFDAVNGRWLHAGRDVPAYANTLLSVSAGGTYWMMASAPVVLEP
ncbi:MAG: CAP domain-containing protein [Chloroflexi bacterium]|nr:CAP domain-containing protein [Chloroflexota bacterium]